MKNLLLAVCLLIGINALAQSVCSDTKTASLLTSFSTSSAALNAQQIPAENSTDDLVLYIEVVDSRKLLRISFNGEEGKEGTLKIKDSNGGVSIESNFELIKTPFYSTVDISSLADGQYSATLLTTKGTHTLPLIIN